MEEEEGGFDDGSVLGRTESGNESPTYMTIHTESEFEIRFYRDSAWISAYVDHPSFHQATKFGFHRLFQYIQDANLNFSRIPMTKLVLMSIVPGSGPLNSLAYSVRFYLPLKFQDDPPVPLPEIHLKPVRWAGHYVAVSKFSGFARDRNVVKEAEKLAASLHQPLTWHVTSHISHLTSKSDGFRVEGHVKRN
ncbi:hypothetical protein RND81_11G032100 [Saponaria officinalis]|uniref:SOUL heme-binding protein n=1 Tax=Saponaria officinalis TaxID=3572 RepID=A0AAW1HHJ2_SAPOF